MNAFKLANSSRDLYQSVRIRQDLEEEWSLWLKSNWRTEFYGAGILRICDCDCLLWERTLSLSWCGLCTENTEIQYIETAIVELRFPSLNASIWCATSSSIVSLIVERKLVNSRKRTKCENDEWIFLNLSLVLDKWHWIISMARLLICFCFCFLARKSCHLSW